MRKFLIAAALAGSVAVGAPAQASIYVEFNGYVVQSIFSSQGQIVATVYSNLTITGFCTQSVLSFPGCRIESLDGVNFDLRSGDTFGPNAYSLSLFWTYLPEISDPLDGLLHSGRGAGAWSTGNTRSDLQLRTARLIDMPTSGANGLTFALSAPEPASWAMMISGFGLVGASLRRRHPVRSAMLSRG